MTAEDLEEKLRNVDTGVCRYPLEKCKELIPVIERINALKREQNAVLLAHTYVSPEIIYGVADHVGDSYFLARKARESTAETIVFSAVRFMAETAKILSPEKRVIHPNDNGGCTLADSISGEEVRELRKRYPDYTFVCYINTTAAVKAECDVCVTSGNVYKIVEHLDNDKIYFLPDKLMAQNLIQHLQAHGIKKTVLSSAGVCYVHEGYSPEMIDYVRLQHGEVSVAVHPECSPEVVAKADFVGSTAGIYNHVRDTNHNRYLLVTECGLSARVQAEIPGKKVVGSCTFCRYMQANSLQKIAEALESGGHQYDIELDPEVSKRASRCIERMFEEAEKKVSKPK